MSQNMGTFDRVARIILGLVLVGLYFVYPTAPYRWAFLLGIVPLATGLLGWCGLYAMLGISTCPMRRR